jgi:uncharacterized protein YndB with AHSA1/START domain
MSTTRSHTRIRAPRSAVYRALLDADAVRAWRVPDGMRSEIHVFEPVPGGAFRISLIYDDPERIGKTAGRTDIYHGRFVELDPDQRIVEAIEFETDDPALQGEMTITTTLADAGEGTELTMLHEGLPPAVRPADNETGTRMALAKLAALLERET